jgi:aldose 1-epimerase
MHSPLTISSPNGETRAVILPTLGFNCIEFSTSIDGQTVSVLDTEPGFQSGERRPVGSGIPLLFPFPNRIKDGKFSHRGQSYVVSPSEWSQQTIHGFCVNRPWKVLETTSHSLTGEFLLSRDAPASQAQWPADARLVVKYTVDADRLHAEITVENPDTVPLPWGFGTHPYFRLPLGGDHPPDDCVIHADASEQWELVECFPTGQKHPIPANKDLRRGWKFGSGPQDDVYTGLAHREGAVVQTIDDPVSHLRLTQRSCDDFRELVVFTPKGRPTICLEPYTCVTDASNLKDLGLDSGWRELAPGEQVKLWFEISVSRI